MPVLDGITAAEQVIDSRIAPVLILTAFSQRELVERAAEAGVMNYLVKPFTKDKLVPAIEIAVSRHTQLTALEGEVADMASRLETRKLVDRAKGILQTAHGMTEPEAFRWIQKTSMDRRMTMKEVAEVVISGSSGGRLPGRRGDPGQGGVSAAGRHNDLVIWPVDVTVVTSPAVVVPACRTGSAGRPAAPASVTCPRQGTGYRAPADPAAAGREDQRTSRPDTLGNRATCGRLALVEASSCLVTRASRDLRPPPHA